MSTAAAREAEVRATIAEVRDPEIDETVAALNFIVAVDIDGDSVVVTLRLPTFWCPANFVFLMGGDIRAAVLALPWVRQFSFTLIDHFAADEISRGISEGRSFRQVFPREAVADLDDLRRSFDKKAFLMRQAALVDLMRGDGFTDDFLSMVSVAALEELTVRSKDLRQRVTDYLEKRRAIGLGCAGEDCAMTTAEGETIEAGSFAAHLRNSRKVTTSAQANGEMCRILMASRAATAACAGHRG
jgi:metal-sulfur cluster biosynthetic enzyme